MYMYIFPYSLSLSFQVPLSVDSPSVSVSGKSDQSDIVAQEATEDLENTGISSNFLQSISTSICIRKCNKNWG